jgi:hypothetical protein
MLTPYNNFGISSLSPRRRWGFSRPHDGTTSAPVRRRLEVTMLRDTLHRTSLCPSCGHTLNGSMAADPKNPDATPSPGDLAVCISCARLLTYNLDLSVRLATDQELEAAIAETPELRAIIDRAAAGIRLAQQVLGPPSDDPNPRGRKN